jgi:hypothetical protein
MTTKTNISRFTPRECDLLRTEFNSAVKELSEKYGINIQLGSMKYSDKEITSKVTFQVLGEGGENEAEKQSFMRHCSYYADLTPEDFGRTFTHQGKSYKIVAINTKKRKFPIICETADKRVCFTEDIIKLILKK